MNIIHQYEFKGKTFLAAENDVFQGSPNPSIGTFLDETNIRDKFWNINPGDVIIDIGAQFGSYTLTACALGGFVYALEPNPNVFPHLVYNLTINNWLNSSAKPFCLGAWDEERLVSETEYAPHSTITDKWPMMPIDKLVANENILKLDWMKVDVEGAEIHVLQGSRGTITRFKPKLIVECHQFVDKTLVDQVMNFLKSLGVDYQFDPVPYHSVIELFASI